MKLFISTACLEGGSDVLGVVDQYVCAGIRAIELGSAHVYNDKLKENLNCGGVEYLMHNYFPPPKEPLILNLASLNPAILNDSIQFVKEALKLCQAMDVKLYSLHGGMLADPVGFRIGKGFLFDHCSPIARDKLWGTFVESIQEIGRYAKGLGINIAIENQGSTQKNQYLLMCEAEEYEELFNRVSLANVGVLLDLGHLNIASNVRGFNRHEFIDRVKNKAFEIHIHENDGKTDTHGKIQNKSWIDDVVMMEEFSETILTLEAFNLTIEDIIFQVRLIKKKWGGVLVG